jgi:hypothetical protein
MSETRKSSTQIRAVRETLDEEDRPTWPPCPGCNGTGQRPTVERSNGRYRGGKCRWCAGTGAIEPKVMLRKIYPRWQKILRRNLAMGRCPRPGRALR